MQSDPIAQGRIDKRGPVPVIIGVTGHRDLRKEDEEALKAKVSQIFTEIKTDFPHTDLILLSPLGEGADRLVAKVALEKGIRLIVPLPMNREEYEKDFKTLPSKEEFSELLSNKNAKSFELPLAEGNTEQNIQQPGKNREHQYAHAAAYIVRHCQILIAIWDGRRDEGHTSQVVKWQLEGIPKHYILSLSLLDPVESGLVYHVATPREKDGYHPVEPFKFTGLPEKSSDQTNDKEDDFITEYRKILSRMDTFNNDYLDLFPRLNLRKEKNKSYVIPNEDQKNLPDTLRSLLDWYGVADTMSSHYQKLKVNTLSRLFWIVFFAVIFFEFYAHLWPDEYILLMFYPILFISAGILNFCAKRLNWENKYQDYRALAEGLRVQFYWRFAGIQDSVADHYLHMQRTEMDWIRVAIKNLCTITREIRSSMDPSTPMKNIELVVACWIGKKDADPKSQTGQYYYFNNKAPFNKKKSKSYDTLVLIFIVLSPLIALKLIVLQAWYSASHSTVHGLILATAFTLLIAALLEGYSQKKAFSELYKRYGWMKSLFEKAMANMKDLIENKDLKKSRDLLKELGKEALVENGNWLLLHRERPLEVPKA